MMKAAGTNDKGEVTTILIGLSRINTERLLEGKPIMFRATELHPNAPDIALVVIANETEDDLMQDFRVIGKFTS